MSRRGPARSGTYQPHCALIAWREALGLTQAQAAALFGVHPNGYQRWEMGSRHLEGAARRLWELYRDMPALVEGERKKGKNSS